MSLHEKRLGAFLLAAALAVAVTTDAQARFGGGGGGGGMHMGGFGGGGGMRMGGFGGGAMRIGGFGGGAMRMGNFGGGGMRFGPSHNIGAFRPGAGAFTARSFHVGARSYTGINHGLGARSFAGSVGHSAAARNIGRAAVGAGALGAGHFANNALGRNTHFVNNAFAHNNWNHQPFHGAFPRPFPGFRGWYGYGWYGPVFWPFAYDILFVDLFWPWYYDYPFWAYGYPDIYGGLFWPYGYDDLAGYLPPGPGPVVYGGGGPAVRGAYARGTWSESRQAEVTGQINQSCGEDSKEVAGWPIDRIEQVVTPTADQRTLLDDLSNASIRAAQAIKEACPTSVAFAPTGRLDAMQKRISGMVQAIDIVAPSLDKFYDSLTDEQKARLNAAGDQTGKNRSLANCGAVSSATQWPGERIEKAVRPDAQQQAKLDALKTAMANAADQLSKSCPSSLPATPSARLSAISMRLNTMLDSVKSVRGALDDFYGSLNDEQKAQFNLIGRQQQSTQKQS
jgi:hypothetical protein